MNVRESSMKSVWYRRSTATILSTVRMLLTGMVASLSLSSWWRKAQSQKLSRTLVNTLKISASIVSTASQKACNTCIVREFCIGISRVITFWSAKMEPSKFVILDFHLSKLISTNGARPGPALHTGVRLRFSTAALTTGRSTSIHSAALHTSWPQAPHLSFTLLVEIISIPPSMRRLNRFQHAGGPRILLTLSTFVSRKIQSSVQI